jgi:Putative beta-barrel porin 2
MSDRRHPMPRRRLARLGRALQIACGAFFLLAGADASFAQSEPPLSIPPTPQLPPPGEAIPVGRWLLYPTIRAYGLYSDNLFQSPTAPVSVWGLGTTPSLTAEWTNGIHTTTLFGNIDRQVYPTDNAINTFDQQANITQKYQPLRDLTFRGTFDFTHKTIASALQNAIPGAVATPQSTVLPNGDTLLPNGTIVSPTGQVLGQANPTLNVTGTSLINPYDQYTGTFAVDKVFNHGILSLNSSAVQTNYENQSAQDYSSRSFSGSGGVWLGPLFYAFSDGSVARNSGSLQAPGAVTSYRARGGIGSRQFGLFRASAYFGHQGSQSATGTAGGEIYGAALSYYATRLWTLNLSADETVNISSQTLASNLALNLPAPTPLQIPLGTSTRITSTALNSDYVISPLWSTSEHFSYTHLEYLNSPRLDNTWLADATLTYNMWRNMSITWEYQYSRILSNAPLNSSTRNYATMSALYKF